jgi:hypothetical protein
MLESLQAKNVKARNVHLVLEAVLVVVAVVLFVLGNNEGVLAACVAIFWVTALILFMHYRIVRTNNQLLRYGRGVPKKRWGGVGRTGK